MSAATLLARIRGYGVELRANGDDLLYRPQYALTPTLVADLHRQKWAISALLAADDPPVAWRVVAMLKRHPRPWRVVPTLTARDVPRGAGGCLSCGEPVAEHPRGIAARCRSCIYAAHLVLSEEG